MRRLVFTFAACCCATAFANEIHAEPLREPLDTIRRQGYQLASQPLAQAIREIARQAGVPVEVKADISPRSSAPAIRGIYSLPEALRHVLFGTGLKPDFPGGSSVVVVAETVDDTPVYNLRAIEVMGVRNRGYSAVRTATATRTDLPLRDAPQSISVVTRDVIADQSMQNMTDVMRLIPGVTMGQGEGHRDAPTIRGNSTTADFFVDGIRDDAQYLRDLYNVERVEALKGANALMFGRGGGGGVVNRVGKEAQWASERTLTLQGGSFEHRRASLDVNQALNENVALRFNGMVQKSGGFRDEATLQRHGINPTLAIALGESTQIRGGYEYFSDDRNVDRGIPSFAGRPAGAPRTAFFGNADSSYSTVRVHTGTAVLEQKLGAFTLRNRVRYTEYDKFYQNSYPGALNAAGTSVALSAYNNATMRDNLFNQTDFIAAVNTGRVEHTFVLGVEVARQRTDNFRETGYYHNTATSFSASFDQPTVSAPITFRQSAGDADNHARVTVASAFAQDQLALSQHFQAILGLRFDRFDIAFHDNRKATDLKRRDELISPRAGLLFKPVESASLYGSYSVSYLPGSGDQFSSLTATTQTLEPEQFRNLEVGAKWDVRPNLSLTAAVYQLDRTNTTAPDPNDATRVVQTGSQRTRGVEAGIAGDVTNSWHVVAGLAWQNAEISSATTAAKAGQTVPLVPERTVSLWNRYTVMRGLGVGLGVVAQDEMFAAIDNTVTLPGFTRLDGAVFVRLNGSMNAQLNVENLLDTEYFATSHGNNNIMPGAGRTLRLTLTTKR
jgi:catecholate siderophore receptor